MNIFNLGNRLKIKKHVVYLAIMYLDTLWHSDAVANILFT